MNYRAHQAGGFTAGAITVTLLADKIAPFGSLTRAGKILVISSAVIGAVLPDIDHPDSHVGRRHRITSSLVNAAAGHRGAFHSPMMLALIYFGVKYFYQSFLSSFLAKFIDSIFIAVIVGLCGFFLALLKHRSFSVAPVVLALSGVFFLVSGNGIDSFFNLLLSGVTLGYASHLFLDFLTVGGIPLFYPLTKKTYHLLKMKSGRSDIYVIIVLLLISVSLLFLYF